MLPDYPKTKALIVKAFRRKVRSARNERLGVLNKVRHSIVHEGHRTALKRVDGTEFIAGMESMQAEASVHIETGDELLAMQQLWELAASLGSQLGDRVGSMMFKSLDKAVTEVGNVIDGKKPMLEQFFEMNEKCQLDFDNRGRPIMPQFVTGDAELARKIEDVIEKVRKTPVLRRRFENIMTKKKQEWLDREAARELVE
jgi:hypothetical protein